MSKYYAVGRRIYLEGPVVPHYMVAECDCSERAQEFVDGVTPKGHCNRVGGCVCGGDLPTIRESCACWVKP